MKDFRKLDKETQHMLSALASMYGQYCNRPYGHDFMGAGEDAIGILEDYGLANEASGVYREEMDKLNKQLYNQS